MHWPGKVLIREVGPRDGLQNEAKFVPTEFKIQLIKALANAGITAIEATSFVHPRAIPQLSDAEAVVKGLQDLPSRVVFSALVGNVRGVERALQAGIGEVVLVISASEAHNRANLNMSVNESISHVRQIGPLAHSEGIRARGAVATAFGCPYQGQINTLQVSKVIEGMLDTGIHEITLADTAGMGNPRQVYDLILELKQSFPHVDWALHFHDTRGLGLANIVMGLQAGVTVLESSVGGLGGCPFIPGATGNVATEDLVNMCQGMGIRTGIDLEGILQCTSLVEETLGRTLSAKVKGSLGCKGSE